MRYRRIFRFPFTLPRLRLPNLSLLLDRYNQGLEKHPYTTKAIGTGITYAFSDVTAQCLESINVVSQPMTFSSSSSICVTNNNNPTDGNDLSLSTPTRKKIKGEQHYNMEEKKIDQVKKNEIPQKGRDRDSNSIENEISLVENIKGRLERTVKFSLVGFLWVGPLLTAWFQVMERFIPGKTLIPLTKKVIIDQIIQGPFMIGTMYFWTAFLNGKSLSQIYKRLEDVLFETWVNSVYVWGPVQVLQQALIPLQYRVAFFNVVSYFWDTYLSYMMMADSKAEIILTQTEEEARVNNENEKKQSSYPKKTMTEELNYKEVEETLLPSYNGSIIDSDYKRKRDGSTPAISRTLSQRRLTQKRESLRYTSKIEKTSQITREDMLRKSNILKDQGRSINEQDYQLEDHLKRKKMMKNEKEVSN